MPHKAGQSLTFMGCKSCFANCRYQSEQGIVVRFVIGDVDPDQDVLLKIEEDDHGPFLRLSGKVCARHLLRQAKNAVDENTAGITS